MVSYCSVLSDANPVPESMLNAGSVGDAEGLSSPTLPTEISVFAVEGLPEFRNDDDLAQIIGDAVESKLCDGDILAITSKIVSKVEGRSQQANDREQAIADQTARVVAAWKGADGTVTRIVENHLGIVGAAAGVDASNAPAGNRPAAP
jgi:coenzyme F420-0:L-glutamate ligase/coenzyme F420-1:gamma-L-glutamate ligase